MDFDKIIKTLNNNFEFEKINDKVLKVTTGASFVNGTPILLSIENKNNKWFLTDGKETLKYMNELYDLKAPDVKMCISNVVKIYGFAISSGIIVCEIPNLDTVCDKVFDMIMCIGQLANMYAFFDKP